MKQSLLLLLLLILLSPHSFSQTIYYSVQDGNWYQPSTWAMNEGGTIPATSAPTIYDTVYIRDSVYQVVPSGHIHRGNVFIELTGVFDIFSGSGISEPYIFAGDSFAVYGKLFTSSDFHNQVQFANYSSPDAFGYLIFGESAIVVIGDDLILNSKSVTQMDNGACGDGTSFDDMYFKGSDSRLCGNGKFFVPDKVRAWDNNNVEQKPPHPQLVTQICLGFNFYGTQKDCEDETNPIITGGATFPVELIDFDARQKGEDVEIYWSTAWETNNHFFTVERSWDGIDYDVVEMVAGAGNSDEVLSYKVIDTRPGTGKIYYRLKQTDLDGGYNYSSVVEIHITGAETGFLMYPNPARGQNVSVELYGFRPQTSVQIYIIDLSGKTVYEQTVETDERGNNLALIPPGLSSGVYFVRIHSVGKILTQKLVY
ncbi:MAG: T9SS type A sorting domain-containing protein [Bacteroidetes bacterium]|nr:T9SS type A sorting domain-containing protein [Bacteroidota bacterium]